MTLVFQDIPESVTKVLEARAQQERRSVEAVALDALVRGLDATEPKRDLSGIAGTMTQQDAYAIEETVKWMDEGDLGARE